MALEVVYTDESKDDLESILDYSVSRFGFRVAEEFYESLVDCIELLALNPGMGKVSVIRGGSSIVRQYPFGNRRAAVIIIYATNERQLILMRLKHSKRA